MLGGFSVYLLTLILSPAAGGVLSAWKAGSYHFSAQNLPLTPSAFRMKGPAWSHTICNPACLSDLTSDPPPHCLHSHHSTCSGTHWTHQAHLAQGPCTAAASAWSSPDPQMPKGLPLLPFGPPRPLHPCIMFIHGTYHHLTHGRHLFPCYLSSVSPGFCSQVPSLLYSQCQEHCRPHTGSQWMLAGVINSTGIYHLPFRFAVQGEERKIKRNL